MTKQNKIILAFLIFIVFLVFIFFVINYIKSIKNVPNTITEEEPQLGYLTRYDRIKHIEWAYRNDKSYKQVALIENGPKDYVVTFYQPNPRDPDVPYTERRGGIIAFDVSDKQPKIIWESTENILLTLPTALDVRDITGDKNSEIIATWSDGKGSKLYLYSWDSNTFNFITPMKKVTGLIGGPDNLYTLVFGIYRGDIQVKDLDGDGIDEVIISGGITRDEIGNEIPAEAEVIYKWDTEKQEYYLQKEEKINAE